MKNNNLTEDEIAGVLYGVYCVEVGGKAFNGDPLPDWREFGADPKKKLQSDGWRAVAAAARNIFSEY